MMTMLHRCVVVCMVGCTNDVVLRFPCTPCTPLHPPAHMQRKSGCPCRIAGQDYGSSYSSYSSYRSSSYRRSYRSSPDYSSTECSANCCSSGLVREHNPTRAHAHTCPHAASYCLHPPTNTLATVAASLLLPPCHRTFPSSSCTQHRTA